jgi:hypothetical protein
MITERKNRKMPRSSSRPSSRPVALPFSFSKPSSKPVTPVVHTHKVEQPGFFSNVFQGFGLGAGQSIAFNMFRSPTEVKYTYESSSSSKEYTQCMKESQNDVEACKQYLENRK